MSGLSRKLQKYAANLLDLPQDVVFNLSRITIIGKNQLYIENHRGVQFFSSELLRLSLAKGFVEIRGKQLVIRAILTEEVMVEGIIEHISYSE